jgi:hypothetical protein
MRWAEDVRNPYTILVGKPDEKKPLGRIVHREEINMERYVKEIRWERLKSPGSEWGPLAGCCEHGGESSGSVKDDNFLSCRTIYCLLRENNTWALSGKRRLYETNMSMNYPACLNLLVLKLRELFAAVREPVLNNIEQ